jgi:hypothetical protein
VRVKLTSAASASLSFASYNIVRYYLLKGLTCAAPTIAPTLAAGQAVVCADKVLNEGVTQVEVTAQCGTPAQVDHRMNSVGTAVVDGTHPTYIAGSSEVRRVDIWTYDFGPNRLMQRIWFEDGRVTRVESLGYGF